MVQFLSTRATKKALLAAMLEPVHMLHAAEDNKDFTLRLALMDEFKSLPANAIWDYYCLSKEIPSNAEWLSDLKQYETEVMFKRAK